MSSPIGKLVLVQRRLLSSHLSSLSSPVRPCHELYACVTAAALIIIGGGITLVEEMKGVQEEGITSFGGTCVCISACHVGSA